MASASIEEAVVYSLKNDATIAGYVGKKIYFIDARDRDQPPYIVVTNAAPDDRPIYFDKPDSRAAAITVEIFTRVKADALAIGKRIVALWNYYRGTIDGTDIIYSRANGSRGYNSSEFQDNVIFVVELEVEYDLA